MSRCSGRSGGCSARSRGGNAVSLGIAIATYNRTDACTTQLRAIADQVAMGAAVARVVVVDQGDDRLDEAPGFADVAAVLGERLSVVRQDNLGGSGGFTRGMREVLDAGCDLVLLLDDDAVPGPEAIFRAATFAGFATRPVIVGGGMLHLDRPAMLYTQGGELARLPFVDDGRIPRRLSTSICREA